MGSVATGTVVTRVDDGRLQDTRGSAEKVPSTFLIDTLDGKHFRCYILAF